MTIKRSIVNMVVVCVVISILLPLLVIAIWAFVDRWQWPALTPEYLSTRGIDVLFYGYPKVLEILVSSNLFSLAAALISTALGFMSARALAYYDFKGKQLIRFGSMLPVIIPANIFAMGIHVIFIRWGLNDTVFGVLICHVIYAMPYTVNILTEVMQLIGVRYEEQANVLGCNPVQALLSVILPLTLPAILASVSMAYIISFSQYFITLLIGGGKVKTFSIIMVPFIAGGDRTIASAYVILFLGSSLLVFVLSEYLIKKLVIGKRKARL